MLKAVYNTIEEVPESVREYYKEEGGKYVITVDGMVPKAKVDEFRATNTRLIKERDDLLEKYKDVDLDEIAGLRTKLQELEDKRGKKDRDLDDELKAKIKAITDPLNKQLEDAKGKTTSLENKLSELMIDKALSEAGAEYGVRSSAIPDLINRGRSIFKMEDGKVVPYDDKGEKMYHTTGDLITPRQFVEKLAESAPHLFEDNRGSGSQGGKGGSQGGSAHPGVNPWKKETLNLTAQGAMIKKDPAKAKRMAAEAGQKLNIN